MKRNFVVSLFGSLVGFGMVLILLSAAGIVGAALYKADRVNSADMARSAVSRANDVSAATPLTSTFTYQGQLKNGGSAVNGSCQMAFRLYDASSGSGLIGSPITTTVPVTNGLFTVGLNFGSNAFNGNGRWLDIQVNCTGTFVPLPRQAVTAAPYALFASNANLLDGQDSSTFVNLLSAQTISGLKTFSGGLKFPDGTTQTTAFYRPNLPGPGAAATVDSGGSVGYGTSVTIGADGLGLISYYDDLPNSNLKVLHCGNAACNGGNISTTVDSAGDVGRDTSITIGADGLGLISYLDSTNGDLKVFHCANAACTSGVATSVDSAGTVGYYTSITIGADGLGLISYYDLTNGDLKVLHCGNADCNGGNNVTTVDSAGDVGGLTSLTIGGDGRGLISYFDYSNFDLKVLHCGNAACNGGNNATTVDSAGNVGQATATTIGTDGLGLISYDDATTQDLKVLHCGNAACTNGNISTTVDSAVGYIDQYTSITIGADGLGLIGYYDDYDGYLKVLHCGNAACSGGNISTTVDRAGVVGYYTSIIIGADGLGLISYNDAGNGDLKVFRCSNLTCTPYTRVGR